MAKSQVECQGSADVPVVLEIRAEEYLPHVPVGVLCSGQLYIKLQRPRLQEIRKIIESVRAIASAAATDLLVPIVPEVHAHAERMHAVCNRDTIHNAPELLLIVRLVYAITNGVEGVDNDFTQQAPSRTKCELGHIPVGKRDVL